MTHPDSSTPADQPPAVPAARVELLVAAVTARTAAGRLARSPR